MLTQQEKGPDGICRRFVIDGQGSFPHCATPTLISLDAHKCADCVSDTLKTSDLVPIIQGKKWFVKGVCARGRNTCASGNLDNKKRWSREGHLGFGAEFSGDGMKNCPGAGGGPGVSGMGARQDNCQILCSIYRNHPQINGLLTCSKNRRNQGAHCLPAGAPDFCKTNI